MSLGVLNNLSAMYAENNLNNTTSSLNTVLQQLSSGSRINSGADDAAGLSLVNGLQANSMALTQSETNAQEGVGLLQVADGALSQVTSLLNRAVTLATEASNGTLNTTQDAAANQEYQSILSEVSNIGSTTTYNDTQVFNSNTNIYTGDSSTAGASVDALNIRSLSSANVGDSSGTMAYSSGANNVFLDLSTSGKNASVTDTLGTVTSTTTVAVSYLSQGANGSAVSATANISVGAGTNYSNTAQGMISAINNSGLGITATFGTATQAGTGAASTATGADDVASSLLTGGSDTGIIISGKGVGVNNNSSAAGYSNGSGEVGTLTTSTTADTLSGTLNITGSDGQAHAITLGTANSTDTLANLEATVNAAGYGVTASLNTASVTNATGAHGVGTVLSFTTASSTATVSTIGATDTQGASVLTLGAAGTSPAVNTIGHVITSITANSATDTLTGVLTLTPGGATAGTPANLNLAGGTVNSLFNSTNGTALSALTTAGITATVNAAGTGVTFTETATTAVGAALALTSGSQIQDSAAATGTAVVTQTNAAATGAFGTVTTSNANDTLSGTLTIGNTAITLGTAGSTDTLSNLMTYINSNSTLHTTDGVTASLNTTGSATVLTLTGTTATDDTVYGTSVGTTLALTGTPTSSTTAAATTLGTLALPGGRTSSDALSGTLTVGTESITLGSAATSSTPGTATMTELAETINGGNYGFNATLNSAGTAMTLTSPDSAMIGTTPTVSAALDSSDSSAPLTFSTANQGTTSSAYYSIGISGTVQDTSTTANTTTALTKGNSADYNGSGGVATISYADGVGANLSATALSSQGNAQSALTALNAAISDVAAQDGYVGAQINTLNSVSQVLSTQQDNVVSAQNAVQATDYAAATSNMSKYEILSQTGISALAQANSMQQEVTKLLQ
jgi:flagellin